MEFLFPKIEKRTIYPRTFLKDVCVNICFKPVLTYEEAIRNFIELRQEYFRIPSEERVDLRPNGEEGSAVISSSDNKVVFYFYLDAISLKVRIPTYKQFEDLLAFMPAVTDFLKSQGVESLDRLRITKFNETQYGLQSDTSSVELAMKGIFSPEMMGWDGFKNPDFTDVARWERRIDFSDIKDNAKAMVLYGFIKDDFDRRKGSLTLKTSVEKDGPIDRAVLDKDLDLCNLMVDSAFHWAASDNILKEMQKK